MTTSYLFDNAAEKEAGQRMAALSALHDPTTFRALERCGIAAGWRCLEVGGGNGSVARWMAERAGPSGHVLVTDIDPRFMTNGPDATPANMEVLRHDVVADGLPIDTFDLVHARLVLLWLPSRLEVLGRLIKSLKPGGWLVLEEYDTLLVASTMVTADRAAAASFERMATALRSLQVASGADPVKWARQLYRTLRDHGLSEVGMNGLVDVRRGGSIGASLQKANFSQVRKAAIDAGLITGEIYAEVMQNLDDPTFDYVAPTMMTAWGRKPASA